MSNNYQQLEEPEGLAYPSLTPVQPVQPQQHMIVQNQQPVAPQQILVAIPVDPQGNAPAAMALQPMNAQGQYVAAAPSNVVSYDQVRQQSLQYPHNTVTVHAPPAAAPPSGNFLPGQQPPGYSPEPANLNDGGYPLTAVVPTPLTAIQLQDITKSRLVNFNSCKYTKEGFHFMKHNCRSTCCVMFMWVFIMVILLGILILTAVGVVHTGDMEERYPFNDDYSYSEGALYPYGSSDDFYNYEDSWYYSWYPDAVGADGREFNMNELLKQPATTMRAHMRKQAHAIFPLSAQLFGAHDHPDHDHDHDHPDHEDDDHHGPDHDMDGPVDTLPMSSMPEPVLHGMDMDENRHEESGMDLWWIFELVSFVLSVFISTPLVAGFYNAVFNAMRNNTHMSWKDALATFKCGYTKRVVFLGATLWLVNRFFVWIFFWPSLYWQIATMFAIPLHVNNDFAKTGTAIKGSCRRVHSQCCNVFLFVLLLCGMNLLGLLCFGVGLFFTIPWSMVSTAYAYHHLVGVNGVTVYVPVNAESLANPQEVNANIGGRHVFMDAI